jgi:hypothetical protein
MSDLDQESSLRDAISSAFDAKEAEATGTEPVAEAAEATTSDTDATDEAPEARPSKDRDETGRFAKTEKAQAKRASVPPGKAAPVTQAAAAPVASAKPGTPAVAAVSSPTPTELKAPAGWNAAEREAFKVWPKELQETAIRRERDYAVAIQKHAEGARFGQQVQQRIAPFVQPILAQGGDPLQTMESLFRTAYTLDSGTPQQKAALVAQILNGYGVDLDLVNAQLGPGTAQPQAQHVDPDTLVRQTEERVMRTLQQQRMQSMVERETAAMEDFAASHEHFEDVRETMADLLDVAAKRGKKLTPEEAYTRACSLDPTVSGILEQRKAAAQANASQASTQRSRDAASSIRGQPTGGSPTPQSNGLRGDIEAAWGELSGR